MEIPTKQVQNLTPGIISGIPTGLAFMNINKKVNVGINHSLAIFEFTIHNFIHALKKMGRERKERANLHFSELSSPLVATYSTLLLI